MTNTKQPVRRTQVEGRPNSITLPGCRVPADVDDRFRRHAKDEGMSMSEAMRRVMEFYLAEPSPTVFRPDEVTEIRNLVAHEFRGLFAEVLEEARTELGGDNELDRAS